MNVLDIDLDFFLDPRPNRPTEGRLDGNYYTPWNAARVETFLTRQCKLQKCFPIPGAHFENHHELFDVWKNLITTGQLSEPFHLTHIDSHADMGMGDTSCNYIMRDLLHRRPSSRIEPKRSGNDGLLEGNFGSFAVACRWIASIDYVHHPNLANDNCGLHDIPNCLFKNNDPRCGILQFKKIPATDGLGVTPFENIEPIALEPEVPIRMFAGDSFSTSKAFSYIFVTQSPQYTPITSDPLFETIRQFIRSD